MNASRSQSRSLLRRLYRPLLVSSLLTAGLFHIVPKAIAVGTEAGTTINNTATATYTDGTNNFTTTSNQVTVTVAEVAGLTAVPDSIVDLDAGAVEAGDTLSFNFRVTNTGNDTTSLNIPIPSGTSLQNFTVTIGGAGTLDTGVRIYEADGTNLIGYLQADGTISSDPDTFTAVDLILDPDQSIIVQVVGTPASGTTAGQTIAVTLGDTGDNLNSAGTQNQADAPDTALAAELRTINETGDATDPVNGQREASAFQGVPFAADLNNLVALAQVSKLEASYTPGDLTIATDDTIEYNLGLAVANTDPAGLYVPSSLEGTPITLNGVAATRILVSDVIPAGTVLQSVVAPPTGWTTVYSISDPATTSPTNTTGTLTAAQWTTTAPVDLSTVKRIGFIYDGQLAAGYSIDGFQFTVRNTSTTLPITVSNIAQVFGETVGDTGNNPVYDESGDNRPNNYDDDSTPPADPANPGQETRYGGYDPDTDTGVPGEGGETTGVDDNDTTNDGTGEDGEALERLLTVVTGSLGILNGPDGFPAAVGPAGTTNDDFTEKSVGDVGTGDPNAVSFTNTVRSTSTATLSNVTVQPITDTNADGTSDINVEELPANTTVIVTSGSQTATYLYDPTRTGEQFVPQDPLGGGAVVFSSAMGGYVLDTDNDGVADAGETITSTFTPVNLGNIAVGGADVNYQVSVDLPVLTDPTAGTVLDPNQYIVPMIAFADDDPTNTPGYTGETTKNLTLDTLYAEYVVLRKAARILDANGTALTGFLDTGLPDIQPGQSIEYQITYTNITTAQGSGINNTTLSAQTFVVTENGTTGTPATANNWALDNDTNGVIDTLHLQGTTFSRGTMTYTLNGGATGTTDPADGAQVDIYLNTVGTLLPQENGTMTFKRELQ
ncbi:beta strand repeat-containing protein [Prochlorothrix hollandica]|uniref:beta strand repeat-containing protein n=1 Tax=Prochlorothrix hollandica TaxID=1223 RepID=UPI00333F4C00